MSKNILWVEDDAYILKKLLYPLERDGWAYDIARTLQEYYDISDETFSKYKLAIIDILIPSGNSKYEDDDDLGIKVIKHIRNNRCSDMPIIVLTGLSESFEYHDEASRIIVIRKAIKPSYLKEIVDNCKELINVQKKG